MGTTTKTRDVRTWIEVDHGAIKKNYETFRSIIPGTCKLMSVVKSNAYGHGLVDFSREIVALGADWFGVDSVIEALTLRKEGIKIPILVLGYTLPSKFEEAIVYDISLTISSQNSLDILEKSSLGKRLKVHIKVDTGMHRQGFLEHEIDQVIEWLKEHKDKVELEGLYTHFAAAKDPAFLKDTKDQLAIFGRWTTAFHTAGLQPLVHAAATGGALLFPEAHFDMVRIGIGLHGLWPAQEIRRAKEQEFELVPTLTWKTLIGEIKSIPKGDRVGYNFTETLMQDSTIAICPIGYWHGYPTALSSIAEVLIRGKRARILGRVSMDMIVVDVSAIPDVEVEDEVVLIGQDGEDRVSTEELASLAHMVNYEFVTRINPLIKKIYR